MSLKLGPISNSGLTTAKKQDLRSKSMNKQVQIYADQMKGRVQGHQFSNFLQPHCHMPYRIVKKSGEELSQAKLDYLKKNCSAKNQKSQYERTEFLARIGDDQALLNVCAFHAQNNNQEEFRRWTYLAFLLIWGNVLEKTQDRDTALSVINTVKSNLLKIVSGKGKESFKKDLDQICAVFVKVAKEFRSAQDFFIDRQGSVAKLWPEHKTLLQNFGFTVDEIDFFNRLAVFSFEYHYDYYIQGYLDRREQNLIDPKFNEHQTKAIQFAKLATNPRFSSAKMQNQAMSFYYIFKRNKKLSMQVGNPILHFQDAAFIIQELYDPVLYRQGEKTKSRIDRMLKNVEESNRDPDICCNAAQLICNSRREIAPEHQTKYNRKAYDLIEFLIQQKGLTQFVIDAVCSTVYAALESDYYPLDDQGRINYAKLKYLAEHFGFHDKVVNFMFEGAINPLASGKPDYEGAISYIDQYMASQKDILLLEFRITGRYKKEDEDDVKLTQDLLSWLKSQNPIDQERSRTLMYGKWQVFIKNMFNKDADLALKVGEEMNSCDSYLHNLYILQNVDVQSQYSKQEYRLKFLDYVERINAFKAALPDDIKKLEIEERLIHALYNFYSGEMSEEDEKYDQGLHYARLCKLVNMNGLVGYIYFSQTSNIAKQIAIREYYRDHGGKLGQVILMLLDVYEDVVELGEISESALADLKMLRESFGEKVLGVGEQGVDYSRNFKADLKLQFSSIQEAQIFMTRKFCNMANDRIKFGTDDHIAGSIFISLDAFISQRSQTSLWRGQCEKLITHTEMEESGVKDPDQYQKLISFYEHLDELMTAHDQKEEAARIERDEKLAEVKQRLEAQQQAKRERKKELRQSRRQSVQVRVQESSKALMNKFRQHDHMRTVPQPFAQEAVKIRKEYEISYISAKVQKEFEILCEQEPKVKQIWEEVLLDPLSLQGSGQPEVLKREFAGYKGVISRRINDYDRLVYKLIPGGKVIILSCSGHYEDQVKKH